MFCLFQSYPYHLAEQVGRDVSKPARLLKAVTGEDLDGDQFPVDGVIVRAGRRGDQVSEAGQDTKSATDSRHGKVCVCFMERKITNLVVGKDLRKLPGKDWMPVHAGRLKGFAGEP